MLLDVVRSRMLVYFLLRYGSAARLRVVPISRDADSAQTGRPGLRLLERDGATGWLRRRLRQVLPAGAAELLQRDGLRAMLTAPLPGTGMTVGMSSHLFAACMRLHQEQQRIVEETRSDDAASPGDGVLADRVPEGDGMRAREQELDYRFRRYRVRAAEQRARVRDAVREAYGEEAGERLGAVMGRLEPTVGPVPGTVLEAATAETYIALPVSDPVVDAGSR
ncbi:hypothetical protein GCM10027570_25250 [Streptomonospora sediminis]